MQRWSARGNEEIIASSSRGRILITTRVLAMSHRVFAFVDLHFVVISMIDGGRGNNWKAKEFKQAGTRQNVSYEYILYSSLERNVTRGVEKLFLAVAYVSYSDVSSIVYCSFRGCRHVISTTEETRKRIFQAITYPDSIRTKIHKKRCYILTVGKPRSHIADTYRRVISSR